MIYARSFSKTLSGSLRVGFVACAQDIANELADIKMLTSITTSQFTERLVYLMLVDGHYRKYLSRLHERLGEARLNVVRAFERIGLELFVEPSGRHVRLGPISAYRRLARAGGGVAARRHHARTGRRLSSASRALAVDAVQRHRLRRHARAALAGRADTSKPGGVEVEIVGRLTALLGENAYPNGVRGVWGKMVAEERYRLYPHPHNVCYRLRSSA